MAQFGGDEPRDDADRALEILFNCHNRHRDPTTGFWGVGQLSDPIRRLHARAIIGHRLRDFYAWLMAKLDALLAFQNDDGGFADVREGMRRQDGWVNGDREPQGLSNTFATWFRWIAIAMIADALWPGRWRWQFRSMVGIGNRRGLLR